MKKRRSIAIACTALVLSCLTVLGTNAQTLTEAGRLLLKYDVNEDGRVTIADVATILDYMANNCGHEERVVKGKAATCFEDGLSDGSVCNLCGETLKMQQVLPKGHTYGEDGICTGCGLSMTAELDEHGFSYTLAPDGTYYILSSVGRNKDAVVTVPESYNGLPVKAVGIGAFYECTYLEEVVLPESVSAIGTAAFYGCTALRQVNLPQGLLYIGYASFKDCKSLESLSIPVGVMDIPDSAFENCSSLDELTLHSFVETVGKRAFYGCDGLSFVKVGVGVRSFGKEAFGGCSALERVEILDVAGWCEVTFESYDANPLYYAKNLYLNGSAISTLEIPDGVTDISAFAFENAENVTALSLPDGMFSIGKSAFSGCTMLKTVRLPYGLYSIGDSAFSFCGSLTRLSLPESLNDVGSYAFYRCGSLKSVYLPLELDVIESYLFAGCSALTRLYLPDETRTIGEGAFSGCTALSDLELPRGLEEIGKEAFYGCVDLAYVSFYDGLLTVGQGAFGGCASIEEVEIETLAGWCAISFASADANPLYYARLLIADGEEVADPIIPRGVKEIGSYAFCAFPLTALELPRGLVRIGDHAFDGCDRLLRVTAEQGLSFVGDEAFARCTALSEISLPKGLTTLGKGAFWGCAALEEVTLQGGLTVLEENTFADCTKLSAVTLPDGVVHIGDKAFYQCGALSQMPLPQALSSIGKKAFYGCAQLSSVTLPDGLTAVGDDAYYGCTGLTEVQITDLLSYCEILFGTIHSNPLYYASALYLGGTKVTVLNIPEGTLFVGDYAFANYTPFKTVTLPVSLTRIGDCAFMNCTAVATVSLYDQVTELGSYAFYGCTALKNLRLSSALTEIGGSAFEGCARITKITLPEKLSAVGSRAFAGCTAAVIPTLPKGLAFVGDGAFGGCQLPDALYIPEGLMVLGEGAFGGCTTISDMYCPFEAEPLGWANDWNGSTADVHFLPYWSMDGGTVVVHTPVTDKGYAATCTENGLTDGAHCADCGAVLVAQQIIPALGGAHQYEDGVCTLCGAKEPCIWTLENGLLTVTGKGAVTASDATAYPWYERRNEITEIVVTGDITEIGAFAFSGCEQVTKITLGEKVTVIGQDAFSYNTSLKELVFLAPVTYVGQGTVYLCTSLEKVTLTGQTKSAFLQIATVYPYNSAYEEVTKWVAEKETVGPVDLVVKGDGWEYLAYEESGSGLTATAPSGWLDKTDSAAWTTGTAPFNGDTFGYACFSAYLRKTFTLENAEDLKELTMQIIYDENPTVYLNGQLLWSAEGYFDSGYVAVNLNDKLSLLKEGENVLCVTFSNVYGGSTFDMALTCSDISIVVDEDGHVVAEDATCQGIASVGLVNDAKNVLDGDANTVCGYGWDASIEQSITVTFKETVLVDSVYLQCKNEGTTTHNDGITRGTYDVYLICGDTQTKINSAPVLARTDVDGGATVTLDAGVEATGIKIVITSWQGSAWACLADVIVSGREIA